MSDTVIRPDAATPDWADALYDVLVQQDIRQVAYVPDAGHSRLIHRCHAHPAMRAAVLFSRNDSSGFM